MKHTTVIWIERIAVVVLTLAILAGVLLWDAGLYDVAFIPRITKETRPAETVPGTDVPGTRPAGDESESGEVTEPIVTETVEPYQPPEDMPDLNYPTLTELLSAGGKVTAEDYVPSVTVLAKNETPSCMKGLALTRGTVQKSVVVRTETNAAGIALRDSVRNVPIRYVIPYMGYVIVWTDDRACLLTVSGEMLNDNFPSDAELTFARDEEGRPIIRTSGHYSAISSSGSLKPAVYTPDENALRFDMSKTQLEKIVSVPTPFQEYVRNWTEVAEEDKKEGKQYFTSWQKDAVERGISPEVALRLTEPLKPETEPIETEPIETDPIESEPIETEPLESEPIETEPIETEPIETEPEESEPAESEPIETEPAENGDEEIENGEIEPNLTPAYLEPDEQTSADPEPTEEPNEPKETEPPRTEPKETEKHPETKPVETEPVPETYYSLDEGMRWGYKDARGKVLIAPRYLYAYPFGADGLAAVIVYNDTVEAATLAFIDKTGKARIDVAGKLLRDYTINDADVYDGYYQCLSNDETALGSYYFDHGYVRVRHRMVLRTKIYNAYIDEETLIDKDGKEFRMPDGYKLVAYSDGILLLEKGGKYGYMNYRGEWIAQPVYTYAEPFSQGLAVVGGTGAIGMIDTTGAFVINPTYEHVSAASRGVIAAYREKDGWTLFNIVKPK